MNNQRKDKLLTIFNIALRTQNQNLKTEIIDYIATEIMVEAIPMLKTYLEEEETPVLVDYIKKVIAHLNKPLIIPSHARKSMPYLMEDDTTQVITHRDELLLRWSSSFKELPKKKKLM